MIGYGNILRGDDGLGPHIAWAIEQAALPGVRSVIVHQLVPELAEPLVAARLAVFVDAQVAASVEDGVDIKPMAPATAFGPLGHMGGPPALLALAQGIYGAAPPAWLVRVPGFHFGFGEGLSPAARRQAKVAIARIRVLVSERGRTEPSARDLLR